MSLSKTIRQNPVGNRYVGVYTKRLLILFFVII